jgi:hypothetical protein
VVCVSDQTQIGPSVDAELWEEFRENVRDRHGRVRGVLGKELETALRQHLSDDATPTERRLEARLMRIEDALDISSADGGSPVSDTENTHTQTPTPEQAPSEDSRVEKPDPKAPRDNKVRYLAQCVVDDHCDTADGDINTIPRKSLVKIVRDEYGFRKDTAVGYVDELIEHFDLVEKPGSGESENGLTLYVSPSRRDEILREAAESDFDKIAEADR